MILFEHFTILKAIINDKKSHFKYFKMAFSY